MVLMMLADGKIEEEEFQSIKKNYSDLTNENIKDKDIKDLIESASKENVSVEEYLKRIIPYLNDYKKTLIIKAAYLVSAADDIIHEKEKKLLEEIRLALKLDTEFFNKVVDSLQIKEPDESTHELVTGH